MVISIVKWTKHASLKNENLHRQSIHIKRGVRALGETIWMVKIKIYIFKLPYHAWCIFYFRQIYVPSVEKLRNRCTQAPICASNKHEQRLGLFEQTLKLMDTSTEKWITIMMQKVVSYVIKNISKGHKFSFRFFTFFHGS